MATNFKVGDRVKLTKEALVNLPDVERLGGVAFSVIGALERKYEAQLVTVDRNIAGDPEIDAGWLELVPDPPQITMGSEDKWQLRCGKPYRILATDLDGVFPIAIAVQTDSGHKLYRLTSTGGFHIGCSNSDLDLIPVPPKPKEYEGWIAFVECLGSPCGVLAQVTQTSKEFARDSASPHKVVGVIPFKFTHGVNL